MLHSILSMTSCNLPWPTPGNEARSTVQPDTGASPVLLTDAKGDVGGEAQSPGAAATDGKPHIEPDIQTKPAPRSMLIDALRGMAISLVALGHTNQGIIHRGWWGASRTGMWMDFIIYSFHMPAFFFVSGIFVHASVQKRGPWRFTIDRARTLLYPYVVWTLISAASVQLLPRFLAQRPISFERLVIDLLTGVGVWFFPTLFACQLAGMLLRRLPGGALLALAVVIYFLAPHTGINFIDLAANFFPYVAAGMWVGRGYERMEAIPRWLTLCGGIALFGVIVAIVVTPWKHYNIVFLVLGSIGTFMLMLFARSCGRSKLARILAWAGEGSLAIYVAGEYGQGGVRQLLEWAHITTPYPQLILPTIAAIAIPAWAYQYRVRLHLEWLFIAPFFKPKPRVAPSVNA